MSDTLRTNPPDSVPDENLPSSTTTPLRPLWQDLLLILLLALMLLVIVTAIARPWLGDILPAAQADLYHPLEDGDAYLQIIRGPDGQPLRWTSTNVYELPAQRALSGVIRESIGLALNEAYPGALEQGDLPGTRVFELRTRTLHATGEIRHESLIVTQDAAGMRLINDYQIEDRLDLTYAPPLLLYPPTIEAGMRWQNIGVVSQLLGYQYDGLFGNAQPYSGTLGVFENCLPLDTTLVLTNSTLPEGSQRVLDNKSSNWECPPIGVVVGETVDGTGALIESSELLSSSSLPGRVGNREWFPPQQAITATEIEISSPDTWEIKRVARLRPNFYNSSSATFSPVYIPSEPPLLLSALVGGDLTAINARSNSIVWQFHTGGTIYSRPAVDLAHGRIYFGSSDKTLYAVDLRGLFLWSFDTGDNIVTQPLVVNDTLFFGSEDRSFYALDVHSGALRWQAKTGGPIVSSPVYVGHADEQGLVIAGSDDGAVYAWYASNGELAWTFATEGGVEAPLVLADATIYVASRDENLYALRADTGELIWQSELGRVLRTAPAVGQENLYLVDDQNLLHAVRRQSGAQLWVLPESDYSGTPLVLQTPDHGEIIIVSRYSGRVDWIDPMGKQIKSWDNAAARLVVDGTEAAYLYGPTLGGDTLWLADTTGVIQRIGPLTSAAPDQRVRAELAWAQPANLYPFASELLIYTPLVAGDHLLVLDQASNLFRLDPENGNVEQIGTIQEGAYVRPLDPLLIDQTLLVVLDGLYAVDAETAAVRWQVSDTGYLHSSPASDGDSVLWTRVAFTDGVQGPGNLISFSLEDGTERWRVDFDTQPFIGGVMLHEDIAVMAVPLSAYDLATGDLRWRGPEGFTGYGIPAIDANGTTVFVGGFEFATQTGSIRAFALRDGSELWQAVLDQGDALSPLERMWLHDNTVIVPAQTGVYGFAAEDGTRLWHLTYDLPYAGGITVANGMIYALLHNGDLVLHDAATGELVAQSGGYEVNLVDLSYVQRPAVLGDRVVGAAGFSLLGFQITSSLDTSSLDTSSLEQK